MKILALITAKANSKRVPHKNRVVIGGKPLYRWTTDYVKSVESEFEDIAFSSDRPGDFPLPDGIHTVIRPTILCEDCSPHVLSVRHALNVMEQIMDKKYDYVFLFQPTNPIRIRNDLYNMLEMISNGKSLLGKTYYIDKNLQMSYIEGVTGWREDYVDQSGSGVMIRSGSMYVYARRYLVDMGLPNDELDTAYVCIPKHRGYNINDKEDFAIVETFMREYCEGDCEGVKCKDE